MQERLLKVAVLSALIALVVYIAGRLTDNAGIVACVAFLLAVLMLFIDSAAPDLPETTPDADERQRDLPLGFGRAILERVPSPLMVITDQGRIVYANTAAMQLLPQILIGDHFATLVRAPVFVDTVSAVLSDGVPRECEFSFPGGERIFEAQATRLPAGVDFGDDRQVIVRVEDRTEAHRLAEMRSNFIANASHELRTPLASLVGYIETLRQHGAEDPEAFDRFLTIMDRQAWRMHRLVDDLMSLSRIEMAAHVPPSDKAGLYGLVIEAVATVIPAAQKADVALRVDLPEDSPEIVCDRDQILQVMTNLVDNAVKYGARKVEVTAAAPTPIHPGRVGVTVADDGPGIPPQDIHRLTERFFRGTGKQSREVSGTGLGLAIVKHILNRHAGDLQISSSPGEGSQFTVWLPSEGESTLTQGTLPAKAS